MCKFVRIIKFLYFTAIHIGKYRIFGNFAGNYSEYQRIRKLKAMQTQVVRSNLLRLFVLFLSKRSSTSSKCDLFLSVRFESIFHRN